MLKFRLLNPIAPITGNNDAIQAGRLGAGAIFAIAAIKIVVAAGMLVNPGPYLAAMRQASAAMSAGDPELAESASTMTTAMLPMIAMTSFIFALVYVILGVVQWRRANTVISAIVLAITVYGVFGMVMARVSPSLSKIANPMPDWVNLLQLAAYVVFAFMLLAGMRGGLFLSREKRVSAAR